MKNILSLFMITTLLFSSNALSSILQDNDLKTPSLKRKIPPPPLFPNSLINEPPSKKLKLPELHALKEEELINLSQTITGNFLQNRDLIRHILSAMTIQVPEKIIQFNKIFQIEAWDISNSFPELEGLFYEALSLVCDISRLSNASTILSKIQIKSEENEKEALVALGRLYRKGQGVEKNNLKSLKCFLKAYESNYPSAQLCLALLHFKEEEQTPPNYREAFKYFLQAHQNGIPLAAYFLGKYYHQGHGGVNKSPVDSFLYFLHAAKKGLRIAYLPVGMSYKNGQGVIKDTLLALEWFLKAYEEQPFGNKGTETKALFDVFNIEEPKKIEHTRKLEFEASTKNLLEKITEIEHNFQNNGFALPLSIKKFRHFFEKDATKPWMVGNLSFPSLKLSIYPKDTSPYPVSCPKSFFSAMMAQEYYNLNAKTSEAKTFLYDVSPKSLNQASCSFLRFYLNGLWTIGEKNVVTSNFLENFFYYGYASYQKLYETRINELNQKIKNGGRFDYDFSEELNSTLKGHELLKEFCDDLIKWIEKGRIFRQQSLYAYFYPKESPSSLLTQN